MPINENEVVIYAPPYDYVLNNDKENAMKKTYSLYLNQDQRNNGSEYSNQKSVKSNLKIVGIIFSDDVECFGDCNSVKVYVYESILESLVVEQNALYSDFKVVINKINYTKDNGLFMNILINDKVPAGSIYVPEDAQAMCKNYYCKRSKLLLKVDNIYFSDEINLVINQVYNADNFKKLLGLTNIENYYGTYFINSKDYEKLFDKGNFQTSVFVKDLHSIEKTIKKLEAQNYNVLPVKKTLVNPYLEDLQQIADVFILVFVVILTVGIFFICYFIIKLVLKSRNIYFSTIRILGSSKNVAKELLKIELFTVLNLTYVIFITLVLLVQSNVIEFAYIEDLSMYFKLYDYIILYIILFFISNLIANRYAKKLFTKSAMNTYREEV